ncbi:RNA polymerase sigma factor, partial [Salinispira pacifica]
MERESDDQLVRLFLRGGGDRPFVELMERYLPKLRRLLFTLLPGDPEDREDVEQEILTSLYLDLHRFRFRSSFGTYFYRYSRNKAIDRIRKNLRERRKFALLSQAAETGPTGSPEETVIQSESARE